MDAPSRCASRAFPSPVRFRSDEANRREESLLIARPCALRRCLPPGSIRRSRTVDARVRRSVTAERRPLADPRRSIRAKVLAHKGDFDAAEEFARVSVTFAAESDFHPAHAEALMDLAHVLELRGEREAAARS